MPTKKFSLNTNIEWNNKLSTFSEFTLVNSDMSTLGKPKDPTTQSKVKFKNEFIDVKPIEFTVPNESLENATEFSLENFKPEIINMMVYEPIFLTSNVYTKYGKFLNYQLCYSVANSLISNQKLQSIFSNNKIYQQPSVVSKRKNFLNDLKKPDNPNYQLYTLQYVKDIMDDVDATMNKLNEYVTLISNFSKLSKFDEFVVDNKTVNQHLQTINSSILNSTALQKYAYIALDVESKLSSNRIKILGTKSPNKIVFEQAGESKTLYFEDEWWTEESRLRYLDFIFKNNSKFYTAWFNNTEESDITKFSSTTFFDRKSVSLINTENFYNYSSFSRPFDEGLLFLINKFNLGNTTNITSNSQLFSNNTNNVFSLIQKYMLTLKSNPNRLEDIIDYQSIPYPGVNIPGDISPGLLKDNEYNIISAALVLRDANLKRYNTNFNESKNLLNSFKDCAKFIIRGIKELLISNENLNIQTKFDESGNLIFKTKNGCPNIWYISPGLIKLYARIFDMQQLPVPTMSFEANTSDDLFISFSPDNDPNKKFLDAIGFLQWVHWATVNPRRNSKSEVRDPSYFIRIKGLFEKFKQVILPITQSKSFNNICFSLFVETYNRYKNDSIPDWNLYLFIYLCNLIKNSYNFIFKNIYCEYTTVASSNLIGDDDINKFTFADVLPNCIPIIPLGSDSFSAFHRLYNPDINNWDHNSRAIKVDEELNLYWNSWNDGSRLTSFFNIKNFEVHFSDWSKQSELQVTDANIIDNKISTLDLEIKILDSYYSSIMNQLDKIFRFDYTIISNVIPEDTESTISIDNFGVQNFTIQKLKNKINLLDTGNYEIEDRFEVNNLFNILPKSNSESLNSKLKIFSVGIPKDIKKALKDNKITINIYKKSSNNNNTLVVSREFDLNLFVDINKKWSPTLTETELLNQSLYYTYDGKNLNLDSTQSKESNLVYKNHLYSEILQKYINNISGLEISDDSIIKNDFTLVNNNLSDIGVPVENFLLKNRLALISDRKSFYRYIFSDRVFDRIFHIILDDSDSDAFSVNSYAVTIKQNSITNPITNVSIGNLLNNTNIKLIENTILDLSKLTNARSTILDLPTFKDSKNLISKLPNVVNVQNQISNFQQFNILDIENNIQSVGDIFSNDIKNNIEDFSSINNIDTKLTIPILDKIKTLRKLK